MSIISDIRISYCDDLILYSSLLRYNERKRKFFIWKNKRIKYTCEQFFYLIFVYIYKITFCLYLLTLFLKPLEFTVLIFYLLTSQQFYKNYFVRKLVTTCCQFYKRYLIRAGDEPVFSIFTCFK